MVVPVTLTRYVQVFIADIRNCSNKEQEQVRVDKELGKIRKKFASGNVLSGQILSLLMVATLPRSCSITINFAPAAEYDKKKYVWKLLYIYMHWS